MLRVVRKMLPCAAVAVFAALSATVSAMQQPPAADKPVTKAAPALWSLQDDDTTIYMFGLPRFMGESTQWNRTALDNALEVAGLVVLESDQTSAEAQTRLQALVPQLGVNRDGSKLTDTLGTTDLARLESIVAKLGIPLQGINPLKPWLAAFQIQALHTQRQGWAGHPTPTEVIIEATQSNAINVSFLEEPTDLLETVAALPEATHLAMLSQALDLIETDPDQAGDIMTAWTSGDTDRLAEIFHGEGAWADERLRTAMLIERNEAWTDEIAAMMATRTGAILVAVGAGHLVGPDSIVNRLQARGFEVRR